MCVVKSYSKYDKFVVALIPRKCVNSLSEQNFEVIKTAPNKETKIGIFFEILKTSSQKLFLRIFKLPTTNSRILIRFEKFLQKPNVY